MDKIQKISPWLIGLIAVISAYLWWSLASEDLPVAADVDAFYSLTVIMLVATVGITILFALFQLLTDFKKLKQALMVVVLMAIVVGISYSLASDAAITFLGESVSGSPEESKMVGTGMYTTYITGALAILSIVLSPVIKLIK
jgi:MFS family permease